MSQNFETTFDKLIKELGGERIPPLSTQGEMRADYFSVALPLSPLT